jgi:putative spermidine/putrescine transport system substrate-binding protein
MLFYGRFVSCLIRAAGSFALGGLVAAALAATPVAAGKFDGTTIRLQTWGGVEGEMVRKNVIEPFEKDTGAKVVVEEGWTSASVAKLRAQKNDPQLDVVMFDDIGVVTAAREGLLEPLDFAAIPNAMDIPEKFVFGKDGIGFYVYINSLGYRKAAFPDGPPSSWSVIWEPKYKGKVILPTIDSTSIYKVLMIASFMNGGSQENMDSGFTAMERLKPNVHSLAKNTALIAEALQSGDAAIAAWQVSVLKEYIEKGYPIGVTINLKEGIFGTPGCISIVKGHKAQREAINAFIDRALSPQAQLGIATDFWYSPTSRKVAIPDNLKQVVLPAEGSSVELVKVDLEKFHRDRSAMLERLNKILAP